MPISKFIRFAAVAAVAVVAAVPVAAMAAASTQKGEVSVAQVMEMLGQDNTTARQVLTAYLAGLGEAASNLIDAAGGSAVTCKRSLSRRQGGAQGASGGGPQALAGDGGDAADRARHDRAGGMHAEELTGGSLRRGLDRRQQALKKVLDLKPA